MKVYCAAPIRGNTVSKQFSDGIPLLVEKLGYIPLTELSVSPGSSLTDAGIFSRDIAWLDESSCVIAEVTGASTGVGFEIAYSLYYRKIPVLALSLSGSQVSAMISGCSSPLLNVKEYNCESDIEKHINSFLKSL